MTKVQKRAATLGVLFAGSIGLGAVALRQMESNLVYYWTPTDLLNKSDLAKGATIRLGGMVQQGSKQWDPVALRLRFIMGESSQPGGESVTVESEGAPPQMFREGIGCIVEGQFDGTIFHATRLIVKHGNNYQPPAGHAASTNADDSTVGTDDKPDRAGSNGTNPSGSGSYGGTEKETP